MDIKRYLINLKPNTQNIEIENKGIHKIDGLIELLANFKDLKRLSFKNNNIRVIPIKLQEIQSLQVLDISGNPIESLDNLVEVLINLRELQSLNVSLSSLEEEMFLIESLPQLLFINQREVQHHQNQQNDNHEHEESDQITDFDDYQYFQKKNVDEATEIFQDLQGLYKDNNRESEIETKSMFNQSVSKIIQNLKEKLSQQEDDDQYQKGLIQIKQAYNLYEVCFKKTIEYTDKVDERLYYSIASIHDAHAIIFKQMSQIIQEQSKQIQILKTQSPVNVLDIGDNSAVNYKELQNRIELLEEENKKYLNKIIRLSKGENPLRDSTSYKLNQSNNLGNTNPSINISIGNAKNLTLNQLKEVILEIYASKEWFDTKEQKNLKLPPQTMEMHMYEYLTQKYGLKSIVIEQASTIIYSIKKYSHEDNDIAVFTKILRNECDENFRFVQGQLKRTIKELLNMHLKGKYPLKNTAELKSMVDSKSAGFVTIEEITDIINYMYNKEDSKHLIEKVKDLMYFNVQSPPKKKGQKREEISKENMERKKILYSSFENVILDFQLKSHEKFLKPFIQQFKQIDTDSDGVINEEEFIILMNHLNLPIPQSDIEKYLKMLDPFTTQTFTFSQIVNLFSEQVIQVENTSMSILQHLSINQAI
ncbi:EF hand protein (macronuclear) [Tetrahymena thermophila SB210]|uniref:EF hand protein n=1 Tax=Tetrahymena thermophila (strain SB210) TaxID=312017 RepID=Q24CE8_TETTS|nr:EF hand protein [Tetrahymena thermophila SB210]EAS05426.2 EF hand protein [Tetrahymena thermophila SB210]|eukprot:XP_001025671.2 EF hand protein [Tetrahymena thermophila SB210]